MLGSRPRLKFAQQPWHLSYDSEGFEKVSEPGLIFFTNELRSSKQERQVMVILSREARIETVAHSCSRGQGHGV